jgi:hypothetical protein
VWYFHLTYLGGHGGNAGSWTPAWPFGSLGSNIDIRLAPGRVPAIASRPREQIPPWTRTGALTHNKHIINRNKISLPGRTPSRDD